MSSASTRDKVANSEEQSGCITLGDVKRKWNFSLEVEILRIIQFNNNLHFFTKSISIVYNIFGLYDFNVLNSKKEFVRVYEKFRLEFYEDIFPIAKQTGAPPCYNDVLSFDERFQLFPLKWKIFIPKMMTRVRSPQPSSPKPGTNTTQTSYKLVSTSFINFFS